MATRRSERKRPMAGTPVTEHTAALRISETPTSSFRLLDLPEEMVMRVLTNSDCATALVRLSQTCKSLCRAARSDAIWKPILIEFFGGELPPASTPILYWSGSSSATGAPPTTNVHEMPALEALRQQVRFAGALRERELSLQHFIIPQDQLLWRCGDGQERHLAFFSAMRDTVRSAWEAQQEEKKAAAEARGETYERARFDHPLYCYRTTMRIYGEYVLIVARTDSPDVPRSEASLGHWVKLSDVPLSADALAHRNGLEFFYGLMCEFVDSTIQEMAERLLGEGEAERIRARNVRRSLEGRYATTQGEEADIKTGRRDDRLDGPRLTAGAHALPKLLCGLYGGCFVTERIPQCMGVGPFLQVQSVLDGKECVTWDMDDF